MAAERIQRAKSQGGLDKGRETVMSAAAYIQLFYILGVLILLGLILNTLGRIRRQGMLEIILKYSLQEVTKAVDSIARSEKGLL